jgi:hypothetical protein
VVGQGNGGGGARTVRSVPLLQEDVRYIIKQYLYKLEKLHT